MLSKYSFNHSKQIGLFFLYSLKSINFFGILTNSKDIFYYFHLFLINIVLSKPRYSWNIANVGIKYQSINCIVHLKWRPCCLTFRCKNKNQLNIEFHFLLILNFFCNEHYWIVFINYETCELAMDIYEEAIINGF